MLKLVQYGNHMPFSFPVNPDAEFQPGQIAQIQGVGNQIVCGVSDGTAPIGFIDDIKTTSFSSAAVDEVIRVPVTGVPGPNNTLVTPNDIKVELRNPLVIPSSFVASIDVELIPRNGVITFLAGTPLNFSYSDNGTPDGIYCVVNYSYQQANIPGDDSTAGSGRVTVWSGRIIAQTDQYDTTARYPINAPLFVNQKGLLTTKQIANYPMVAICLGPPSSVSSMIEFMWL